MRTVPLARTPCPAGSGASWIFVLPNFASDGWKMVCFSKRSKKKSEREARQYALSTAALTSGALPFAQPT